MKPYYLMLQTKQESEETAEELGRLGIMTVECICKENELMVIKGTSTKANEEVLLWNEQVLLWTKCNEAQISQTGLLQSL